MRYCDNMIRRKVQELGKGQQGRDNASNRRIRQMAIKAEIVGVDG